MTILNINQIFKLFLLLAICLDSFAQFEDELFKEIEIELGEIDLTSEGIVKLENTIPDYQLPDVKYKEQRFDWDRDFIGKMQSVETRQAVLKRGTRVYSLKEDKFFDIPRNVNVIVLAGFDREKQTYILNKKNEVVFQVNFEDVIITNEVKKLHTRPQIFEEYEPREEVSYDKTLRFHEISFVAFNQTADFISDTLKTNSDSIVGTGAQYQLHFDFDFPMLLGIETNYLAGTSETGFGEYNITQLTLGPVVNVPVVTFNNRKVFAQFGSQFGLFHRIEASDSQEIISFNSQSYSVGLRFYFPTIFGELVAGLRYAVDFRNPKSSDVPTAGDDVQSRDQSIALSGGISW